MLDAVSFADILLTTKAIRGLGAVLLSAVQGELWASQADTIARTIENTRCL